MNDDFPIVEEYHELIAKLHENSSTQAAQAHAIEREKLNVLRAALPDQGLNISELTSLTLSNQREREQLERDLDKMQQDVVSVVEKKEAENATQNLPTDSFPPPVLTI